MRTWILSEKRGEFRVKLENERGSSDEVFTRVIEEEGVLDLLEEWYEYQRQFFEDRARGRSAPYGATEALLVECGRLA